MKVNERQTKEERRYKYGLLRGLGFYPGQAERWRDWTWNHIRQIVSSLRKNRKYRCVCVNGDVCSVSIELIRRDIRPVVPRFIKNNLCIYGGKGAWNEGYPLEKPERFK